MKYNNKFTFIALIILFTSLISCGASQSAAEKAKKAKQIDAQIENLDFRFIANHAYPIGYPSIPLTSEYDVTVMPDTIKAYLPFFGRAYRAPMNSSEGGIKFENPCNPGNLGVPAGAGGGYHLRLPGRHHFEPL